MTVHSSWAVEYRGSQRWALSKGHTGMEGNKSLETGPRPQAQLGNHPGSWSQSQEWGLAWPVVTGFKVHSALLPWRG